MADKQYVCIDLKSFYASVECVERGLDPMTTDLVVADPTRSEKTICLAVSPSLKAKGVRNRCRVFEIPKGIDYIMAPPRMKLYIKYSADIYGVLLKYVSKDDLYAYSIDESFIDVTGYLALYGKTARELGELMRDDIRRTTGIPATCGMGPNLYLAKVALDITAKHSPGFFGALDEESYRAQLWNHRPITDFWRVGPGIARRLAALGIETMGQVATYPYPERLYKEFGIDAEVLIDHAWGIEPVTIADIKAYKRKSHSIVSGQVLPSSYSVRDARTVVKEMVDGVCLDMAGKGVAAKSLTLALSVEDGATGQRYEAAGTVRPTDPTNSRDELLGQVLALFDRIAEPGVLVKKTALSCNDVVDEDAVQQSLFMNAAARDEERARQRAILDVKEKFGKNALLRGTDLLPKATQRERNTQVGGHRGGE